MDQINSEATMTNVTTFLVESKISIKSFENIYFLKYFKL